MSNVLTGKDFLDVIISDLHEDIMDKSKQVYEGVVLRTPVMTGQTRASWNMTEGEPDLTTVDEGGAIGSPIAVPETPSLKLTSDYPEIHVANGKSHITYLENGSPTTQPSAMVAATLASIK